MEGLISLWILNRDNWICQECGHLATACHHVIPRSRFGKKGKVIQEQECNLISLCEECHAKAHTTKKRKEHLLLLARLHGYKYTERRFMEALNS